LNNRSNGQNNNNNNGNNGNNHPCQRTGAVNYLNFEEDYEYNYENEEEWYKEDDEEFETYIVTIHSRSAPYDKNNKNKCPKFSESRKEEELRAPFTQQTTTFTQPIEADTSMTDAPPSKRKVKTKLVPASIENVNEFDIAKYISNLLCGLSIGQASAQLPVYCKGLMQSVRRKREKIENNYIGENYYGDSNSENNTPTTAAKCEFYIKNQSVIIVIDSGAAVSIMTKAMMNSLGLKIQNSSDYVIRTANGTKIHSLREIKDLPLTIKGLIVKTSVQVIDSTDSIFILGNNWMRNVKAALDWQGRKLTINHKGRTVTMPVVFSIPKPTRTYVYNSEESEEEYEYEELKETPIYYSDFLSDEDLEFNPWEDEVSPTYTLEEENLKEKENPALFLIQAEIYKGEKANSNLHLRPLEYNQQIQFQQLFKDYADICAQSQIEIGRTNITKHCIITQDAVPISQSP
jgi:hypothetical protein